MSIKGKLLKSGLIIGAASLGYFVYKAYIQGEDSPKQVFKHVKKDVRDGVKTASSWASKVASAVNPRSKTKHNGARHTTHSTHAST